MHATVACTPWCSFRALIGECEAHASNGARVHIKAKGVMRMAKVEAQTVKSDKKAVGTVDGVTFDAGMQDAVHYIADAPDCACNGDLAKAESFLCELAGRQLTTDRMNECRREAQESTPEQRANRLMRGIKTGKITGEARREATAELRALLDQIEATPEPATAA